MNKLTSIPTLPLLLVLVLAALAGGTWYYEANVETTAGGLDWVRQHSWSAYLGLGVFTVVWLVPLVYGHRVRTVIIAMAMIEIFLTLLVFYFLSRIVFLSLATGWSAWLSPPMLYVLQVVLFMLTSYSLWLTTNRRLYRIGDIYIVGLTAALVGAAMLTWFLLAGIGSHADVVEIARTGVFQFFASLLIGLIAWLANANPVTTNVGRNDVLDDDAFRPYREE